MQHQAFHTPGTPPWQGLASPGWRCPCHRRHLCLSSQPLPECAPHRSCRQHTDSAVLAGADTVRKPNSHQEDIAISFGLCNELCDSLLQLATLLGTCAAHHRRLSHCSGALPFFQGTGMYYGHVMYPWLRWLPLHLQAQSLLHTYQPRSSPRPTASHAWCTGRQPTGCHRGSPG